MIQATNLTKYYGKQLAVDDISFTVKKGEIVGLLGPNASGKTTIMRMITGYLSPSRGKVSIADLDMMSNSLEGRRLIGYMPEVVPLYADMTTRAYLEYVARLRGLNKKKAKTSTDDVLSTCGLEKYADVILRKLSRGFKQRVGLAQAIVHDPEVLILDEPTVGIDPRQVAQTRQLIKELGKARTILLSTHILSEVSMICERVIIIQKGRIVAEDRIEKLSRNIKGGNVMRLKIRGAADEVTERLSLIVGIQKVAFETPYHVLEFPFTLEPQAEITEAIIRSGWTLLSMESVEKSLEEIFLQLTTEEETGK